MIESRVSASIFNQQMLFPPHAHCKSRKIKKQGCSRQTLEYFHREAPQKDISVPNLNSKRTSRKRALLIGVFVLPPLFVSNVSIALFGFFSLSARDQKERVKKRRTGQKKKKERVSSFGEHAQKSWLTNNRRFMSQIPYKIEQNPSKFLVYSTGITVFTCLH